MLCLLILEVVEKTCHHTERLCIVEWILSSLGTYIEKSQWSSNKVTSVLS